MQTETEREGKLWRGLILEKMAVAQLVEKYTAI
jgi:hypothetical protein